MNWLRAHLLNPNVHGVLTALLGIAAMIPGPAQSVAAILTPVFAGITTILPESGSLHREDYAKAAGAAIVAVPQGSLHANDYANIATAVVNALKPEISGRT